MSPGLRELFGRLRGGLPARWPWSRHGLAAYPLIGASRRDRVDRSPRRSAAPQELELRGAGSFGRPARARRSALSRFALPERPETRREAGNLVQQRYSSRGYQTSATMINPNVCTFAAYDEGKVAGTVSLRLDSKDDGLAADQLYRAEIDAMRAKGQRSANSRAWRLSVGGVAARAGGPFPHGLSFRAERSRLRFCRDRSEPATCRILPALAGFRGYWARSVTICVSTHPRF